MHFPKKRVEGSFDSIREAYLYRLEQLPDRDSDEQHEAGSLVLEPEARHRGPGAADHGPRAKPQSSPGKGDAGSRSTRRRPGSPTA